MIQMGQSCKHKTGPLARTTFLICVTIQLVTIVNIMPSQMLGIQHGVDCNPNRNGTDGTSHNMYKREANDKLIPLKELVGTSDVTTLEEQCQGVRDRRFIKSTILPERVTHRPLRRIPNIIHVTAKSACTTLAFANNVDRWRFPNYSLYFHDEQAVDRLLSSFQTSNDFPHLAMFLTCLQSGAAKSDIWRYVVLWHYGGIYVDIDSAPGPQFQNGTAILDSDHAWFVVERTGILSQYFMAATPHHSLLYFCVHQALNRLFNDPLMALSKQYAPFVTGPGALKHAFITFQQTNGGSSTSFSGNTGNFNDTITITNNKSQEDGTFQKVRRGIYWGVGNQSVTVKGVARKTDLWIRREALTHQDKYDGYNVMGMQHFSAKSSATKQLTHSCLVHLFHQYRNATPSSSFRT